jgi:choline dehydrogenase
MSRSQYDYIVVGAGAAGCTLVREMLRRELGSVLLIEAGSPPTSPKLRVPADYVRTFGSRWDWHHETVLQPGLGNRRVRLPAGKTLGGSTALNAMIYIEAHADDFACWESTAGVEWSEANVRSAVQELRRQLRWNERHNGEDDDHEVALPTLPKLHPMMRTLLEQSSQRGWTASSHPSGFDSPRHGIEAYRRMQVRGRRVSMWRLVASDALFMSAIQASRLQVMTDMRVVRIQFEGHAAQSLLLASEKGGEFSVSASTVNASKGIVLCAGAIETPRLLMASGVGPRDELAWAGIPCDHEMPCLGKNLHDHLVYPIIHTVRSPTIGKLASERMARLQYVHDRTGARSSNLAELGAFFDCGTSDFVGSESRRAPEFQWHITPTHYLDRLPFSSEPPCISFAITPLRPQSRGEVRPAVAEGQWNRLGPMPLAIDPAYLTDEADTETLLRAVAWTRQTIADSPWRAWIADEDFPGARRRETDRVETSLRRFASTLYHYAGTCAMGEEDCSCLDPYMRVRGIDRLWVCDASAMPRLVSCNPQATVMMLAHRLANWL